MTREERKVLADMLEALARIAIEPDGFNRLAAGHDFMKHRERFIAPMTHDTEGSAKD